MVCTTCQKFLQRKARIVGRDKSGIVYEHHLRLPHLRHAAEEEKCLMCATFWGDLPSPTKDALATFHSNCSIHDDTGLAEDGSRVHLMIARITHDLFYDEWSLTLSFKPLLSVPSLVFDDIHVHASKGFVLQDMSTEDGFYNHGSRPLGFSHWPFASRDTLDLELIRAWIQECQLVHTTCNRLRDRGRWNPTRLLEVIKPGCKIVRAIDTVKYRECFDYVTLSHRWGEAQFLKLETATQRSLEQGISVEDLPQTFQDAIYVTLGLGHKYLWIDSLCILQDDEGSQDWSKESSQMDQIYGHGLCNISALGAKDTSEGLFRNVQFDLPVLEVTELAVDHSSSADNNRLLCAVVHSKFWEENLNDAPLNQRGWVMQERLLARRVVHFGERQIFWECGRLDAAETYPNGLPACLLSSYHTGFKSLDSLGKIPMVTGSLITEYWPNKIWCRIVTKYSACKLTNLEDKLLAIAGIAKRMSTLIEDKYVAGMWHRTLCSDLLWRVEVGREFPRSFRPPTYRAPTWSWASIKGPIFVGLLTFRGLRFKVLEYDLQYVTNDHTGLLRGGHIMLQGPMRRIKLHKAEIEDHIWARHPGRYSTDWLLELNDGVFRCSSETAGPNRICFDVPTTDFDSESRLDVLFAMTCCVYTQSDGVRNEATAYMLLLRCEDSETGAFSRLGISIHEKHGNLDAWKLLTEQDANVSSLPCVEFNRGHGEHIIRVI